MSEGAKRWLAFGREDLQVARVVLPEGIHNQVCFHSQQCAEKCLKSLLAHSGADVPRTHCLTDLLGLIPTGQLGEIRDELAALDDYYIPTRYPDALPGTLPEGLPGESEAKEAIALAERVLSYATERVRGSESKGEDR